MQHSAPSNTPAVTALPLHCAATAPIPVTPPRAVSQTRGVPARPRIERTYRLAHPQGRQRRAQVAPATPVRPASRSMIPPPRPRIQRAYQVSRSEDAQPSAFPRLLDRLSRPSTPIRPASRTMAPPSRPLPNRTLPLSNEARAMLDSSLAELEAAVVSRYAPALEGREPASPIGRAQEARALIARLRRDLQA
ncbi:hypothetical protein BOTBODRAFT_191356 [Botryobasidium botryosum FD-172 SS1]|uniref:Uncharacterized protein n=1 Tax=Botryobasidium botryosum (strain FD-172 SS1) TaxID=930990 RepID=A0A067MAX3_BOTB1|nr:hypothetical protein BOTBODRAFT_191356 [Botryobasidium botryosum FD-172 SS1]